MSSSYGLPLPPPRLYGILATKALVVSIFRRSPSQWFHLLRWRLGEGLLEPGVWVRKKLCPKWCDLSTDGELLLCHLSGNFKGSYRGYGGISRVRWLHPLASWGEHVSWGPGTCFVTDGVTHT